jgi:hypothetical protein
LESSKRIVSILPIGGRSQAEGRWKMPDLPRGTSRTKSTISESYHAEVLKERNQFLERVQGLDRLLKDSYEIIKEKDEKISDLNSILDNFELLKILSQSGLLRSLDLNSSILQSKVIEVMDLWIQRTTRQKE